VIINHYLYYGDRLLTAVRADINASAQDVRTKAIAQNDRVPLCYPEYSPVEFATMLNAARVVRDERFT